MFANTIKALTVAVALTAVSSTAMADQYRHRQQYRHHHGHNNGSPLALGIGLGLLGAGLAGAYYYNRQPVPQECWNELSGYDYRGRPVYVVVCH